MALVQNALMLAHPSFMVSRNIQYTVDFRIDFTLLVPRPLIVEEHGLRHLMENQGVGVLLSQESYEFGDWASKIQEAYEKGKFLKSMKRKMGWDDGRKRAADQLAKDLVSWLDEWWSKIDIQVASEAPLPGSLLPSTSQAGEIGIGGIVSGRPIAV